MSVYNKYIVALVLAAAVVNCLLASFGQSDITLYFTLNVIAFLMITLLFVYLNPRARAALNTIGIVFFAAFMVVVTMRVVEILSVR